MQKSPDQKDLHALKEHCMAQIDKDSAKFTEEIQNQNAKLDELIEHMNEAPLIASTSQLRKVKLDLPKFKGHERESPIKFLTQLKKYV